MLLQLSQTVMLFMMEEMQDGVSQNDVAAVADSDVASDGSDTGWYEPEPGCGHRRKQSLQATMQLVMEETQVGVSQNNVVVIAGGDDGCVVDGPRRGDNELHATLPNTQRTGSPQRSTNSPRTLHSTY